MESDEPKPPRSRSRRVAIPGQEFLEQLDRTRQVFSGDAEDAGGRALADYAGDATVDARISLQLGCAATLAQPEAFLAAHRQLARAMEVYDREGSRDPNVPNLWILTPVAEYIVETIADYIKKSYLRQVANGVRRLYHRREVQSPPEAPERATLTRARIEMDRLALGLPASSNTLFGLIAGGAVVSALASLLRSVGALRLDDPYVLVSVGAVTFAVATAISGALLRGAAIARHRSRLIMLPALAELWQTIGNCGDPPEDDGDTIATTAVVITALAWLVLPATALLFSLG